MKKLFVFGAISMLALASCSKDVVVSENRDADVINYGVVTNAATKAADVYCNNNLPASFNVWASHSEGSTYIDNSTVTVSDANSCTSDKTYYWPTSGTLNFFAHVNGTGFTWNNGQPSFVDYTVAATIGEQKDLMYAIQRSVAKPADGKVSLNFRHALSQIVFEARNENPNIHVVIDKIAVCNVNSKGTYTFNTTESTGAKVGEHNNNGNYVLTGRGTWATSVPATYETSFTAVDVANTNTNTPLTTTNDSGKEFSSRALMLLPTAKTTKWDPVANPKPAESNGTYFLVHCTIYNDADGTYNKSEDNIPVWGSSAKTEPIAIPVELTWEEGKKYVYTFVFGNTNGGYNPEPGGSTPEPALLPINYVLTVDDFVPVTSPDVNMQTN